MPPGAVYVGRPGRWGNPWKAGTAWPNGCDTAEEAVSRFRAWIEAALAGPAGAITRAALDEELRGRDLACWCPLDRPCHADVLLELANADPAP